VQVRDRVDQASDVARINPSRPGSESPDVCNWFDRRGLPKMIIAGVLLLLIGLLIGAPILWTVGVILVIVGAILWILGAAGREVGGRRHYY
jgi:hypothetical protein